jgi:hypothetical protein
MIMNRPLMTALLVSAAVLAPTFGAAQSKPADSARAKSTSPAKKAKPKQGNTSTKTAKTAKTANAHPAPKPDTAPAPAFTVTPLPNALLPKKRIVVYYGNPLSKRMGILGEYPEREMLAKLQQEVALFNKAEPSRPVQPGLHLIVTVAQGAPGKKGLYRLRMADSLIDHWCKLAESKGMVIFLDVQVGWSTVQSELQPLLPYLSRPYVHLALDPEFSMHYKSQGVPPGRKIGVLDAADINYAIKTLDSIVKKNNLPPKVLVVHRFTRNMVTNSRAIRPIPNVQVVMNMDGFGAPWLKRDSYHDYVKMHPVQYTGFKIFYKNDKPQLTREEVVKLDPSPLFITFQ